MNISMKCIKIGCTEASLTVLLITKQFGGQNNPVEIIAINKTLFNHDLNVSKFFLSLLSMEIPICHVDHDTIDPQATQRKGSAIEGKKR